MKRFVFLCLSVFIIPTVSQARVLADLGPTFEIQEHSFLEMIQGRLQAAQASGKLQTMEEEVKARVTKKAMHPKPVDSITSTQVSRVFYYDPTITVDEDIKDHRGVLIHHKGKRLNPLHYVSWGAPLVFIDGTQDDQVKWALQEQQAHGGKVVLIKGSPIELYRKHGIRFYFDQAGKITTQFAIQHVPARVSQDGERLRIEEIVIPE